MIESLVATEKARIVSYIDPDAKKDLEALASKRNRSMSNLLETLIYEEIQRAKESGELPSRSNP